MSLNDKITEELKTAMKAKDQAALRGLRAIKSELLLLKTKGGEVSEQDELATLVKMAKQRQDSMLIFKEQNRDDLAGKEQEELDVINRFLPKQFTPQELEAEVKSIIESTGASGMKDMGKVMGTASGKLQGKASGKDIADTVKRLLS